jgi:Ca2+-binding RTX toxin-like protein
MAVPTDILLAPIQPIVNENSINGTLIGLLSVVDVDPTTYSWSLVDSAGGRFALSGNSIVVANSGKLDFEVQGVYTVVVRVTEGGLSFDKDFAILLRDVEAEILTGTGGNDTLTGSLGNDSFSGGAGNDSLASGSGNDTLNGGAGADTMSGGVGNDVYYVDSALDVVIDEALLGGTDIVFSSVTFVVPTTIENVTLTGTAAINATGNASVNMLTGNSANNILDGKGGADTMAGAAGNDTYYVDNTLDVVEEAAGAGTDLVIASVSYSLNVSGPTPAREVENLTLAAGTTNINATGNALANVLTGNDGANLLNGMAGADTMIGGNGNDTYYVDNAGDVVTESLATGGTDTVVASIGFSLAALANIEKLTLSGTGPTSATGNALANTIVGNSGANLIDGGAGIDTMSGGAGNDTYVLDSASDRVIENAGEGIDTIRIGATYTIAGVSNVERVVLLGTGDFNVTGNSLANQLVGTAGANILDGGTGNDTLSGGSGNDTYYVDSIFDVVTEAADGGIDTVISKVSFVLADNAETLTLNGVALINGTGNASANTLTGSASANVLDGGAGNDTIDGGAGNDTIAGGAGNDTLKGGLGSDTFYFSTALNPATNVDTISDFVAGADRILLSRAIFSALGAPGALASSSFAPTLAAANSNSRIIYDATTGDLFYDTDGAGGIASVKFATLTNRPKLTFNDFAVALAAPSLALAHDNGSSSADRITNIGTVNVSGLLAGATWQYSTDGGGTWIAGAGTSFTLTGDGPKYVVVRQTDTGGITSVNSSALAFVLDTSAPAAVVSTVSLSADSGISTTDFVTKVAAQTITGTLSAALGVGDVVRVSLDNGATWQTATATAGNATFSLAGVTLAGTNTMMVRVEDSAGHASSAKIQTYVLDTVAPTRTVTSLDISADTGTSATDFITMATSQTVTGTLSAALLAGEIVRVSVNNGATWQTATTTAGGTTFTLTGATLTASSTILARVEDAAGNNGTARSQTYTLDTTAPVEAVATVAFSADTGASSTDFITGTAAQTISGTLNAALASGNSVKISLDNGTTWQTATAAVGSSTFSLGGVVLTGSNTMIVRVEDIAGNASAPRVQAYALELAPSEVVSTLALSADTGTSATDFITRTAAQTVTGTLSAALAAGNVVKVSIDNGATWQTATAVTGSTTFSLSGVTLTGSSTLIARVEDAVGRPSTAKSQAYTLDTVAPTMAVTALSLSADTGTSAADFITRTAAQTVTGTLDAALTAGNVVKVSLDNGLTWQTATAAVGSTSFSLTGATLSGSGTIIARVEDLAGNFSTARSQAYVLDTTAPTAAVSMVTLSNDTGSSATDFVTSAAAQSISGVLSAAIVAGDVVKVSLDNGATWQTAKAAVGSTSFTLNGVTLTGSSTIVARVEDAAGNFSTTWTQVYAIDTTAAVAPTAALATDSGSSSTDTITKTGVVTVTGLEAGATWQYSTNGGASWIAGTGTSFTLTGDEAKSVLVRQIDAAGNISGNSAALAFTLDTTAAAAPTLTLATDSGPSSTDMITRFGTVNVAGLEAGASWQYSTNGGTTWTTGSGTSFTLTGDGAKSVVVRQTDVAGNTSTTSASLDFVLDATSTITPSIALATDSGSSSIDRITNVGTVNVTGVEVQGDRLKTDHFSSCGIPRP